MENTQNTPPHAELIISIASEKDAMGQSNVTVRISGCRDCLVEGFATHLLKGDQLKEIINKTVRRANELRAQKEN